MNFILCHVRYLETLLMAWHRGGETQSYNSGEVMRKKYHLFSTIYRSQVILLSSH